MMDSLPSAVFVLYNLTYTPNSYAGQMGVGAKITNLHIYDGGNRIKEFNNISKYGRPQ